MPPNRNISQQSHLWMNIQLRRMSRQKQDTLLESKSYPLTNRLEQIQEVQSSTT
jgi:hypothetical protein